MSFGPGVFFIPKEKDMAEKVFKTYDEMIDLLKSRNMNISGGGSRRKAKILLQREGYYNIINGYKRPFLKSLNSEEYKDGTTIDEVFALYAFDRSIREIFLRATLHIETNVKNLISCTFSAQYGHDNYLLYKNFDTSGRDAVKHVTKLISSLQGQLAAHSLDPNIAHYLRKHGYVPLWVLNSVLSFGNMSKFYSVMKQKDRQQVAKVFKLQENTLANFLNYLSAIRNFSAHGNRLYCFTSTKALANTAMHHNLSIPQVNGYYVNGRNDLFGAVIIFRYLLSTREFKYFFSQLNGEINKLSSKLNTISILNVLNAMGFPSNWKEVLRRDIRSEDCI